jgi:hypothetical protein
MSYGNSFALVHGGNPSTITELGNHDHAGYTKEPIRLATTNRFRNRPDSISLTTHNSQQNTTQLWYNGIHLLRYQTWLTY